MTVTLHGDLDEESGAPAIEQIADQRLQNAGADEDAPFAVGDEKQQQGPQLQGRRIEAAHAAFFAPYKGQDLFLEIAAQCAGSGRRPMIRP